MEVATNEASRPGPRPGARTIFIPQLLLTAPVVGWGLDPHRGGVGLALALVFVSYPAHPRWKGTVQWWDALAAAFGLGLCLYIAWRYPTLVNELTSRPPEGIAMSAALALLVIEGARRTTGMALVTVTLA